MPTEQFLGAVAAHAAGDAWVIDGNFSDARHVLWPCGTHVVWLNYSRPRVFAQVLGRTLRRAIGGATLWGGNRESLRRAFFSRDSIVRFSMQTFAKNRQRYADLRATRTYPQLQWVELRSPRQAQAWLTKVRRLGS